MIKIFVSQPMKGKSNEQIKDERREIIKEIKMKIKEPFEILDTVFDEFEGSTPLKYMSKSLWVLSDADYAYFANGWQDARGCVIEHTCAKEYNIKILHD